MTNRIRHLFRNRILPLAGLLLALSAIGYGALRLHQQQNRQETELAPEESAPRPVKLVTVARIASRETATYPGTVRASRSARLAFRVGGPLVEVNVSLGEPVAEGAVLMRIDPRDFAARVAGAESQLEAARARLDAMERGDRAEDLAVLEAKLEADRARLANARLDFDRARKLFADKVIPKADFDQAESAHSVAAANVVKLEQELAKAKAGARAEDLAAAR
ncbi:MAG: biotin/lipoyl-binding protein, partial [Lentisphaeria bacterium]|nr:biotin/lipoyl-binding protein [Lentisphaeria bacterium]